MEIQGLLNKNLLIVGYTGGGKTTLLKHLVDYLGNETDIYVEDGKGFGWTSQFARPNIHPYEKEAISQLIAERTQNSENDYPDVYVIFDEPAMSLDWEEGLAEGHPRVNPIADPLLNWATVDKCARLHIHILAATQAPAVLLSPEEIADKFDYYLECSCSLEEAEGYTDCLAKQLGDRFGHAHSLSLGERRLFLHRLGNRQE